MKVGISELVYGAIDELNAMSLEEQQLEKSTETPLIGPAAKIDSMALVSFIVALEEKIQAEFGSQISLGDENAFVLETSPFRTVGSLIDHVSRLAMEKSNG